jgi:CubicO group peptidase (beta-lactamase class C family)
VTVAGELAALAAQVGATAVVVCDHEQELMSVGDPAVTVPCRSIRKSLLGALFGRHVIEGALDLDATLADLGVDDCVPPPLTADERAARLRDLLTCRSGVYHPANHQPENVMLPPRGTHRPGTRFVYNNWDFNALGTIFTRLTGLGIHSAFDERIAKPLGMQDFRFTAESQDGWLEPSDRSRHPAYPFRMSTRDLARFGLLFLRDGRWRKRQVVPANWTAISVLPYSDAGPRGAYGYMWWVTRCGVGFPGVVSPEGTYSARGAGGHYCVVIPALDLVIVHRVDTDQRGREVNRFQFGELLRLILGARRHHS